MQRRASMHAKVSQKPAVFGLELMLWHSYPKLAIPVHDMLWYDI